MNDQFLTSKQVKARYGGVSDMTLWRWQHARNLGFPQPLKINGRRLWCLRTLEAWEKSQLHSKLRDPQREDKEASLVNVE